MTLDHPFLALTAWSMVILLFGFLIGLRSGQLTERDEWVARARQKQLPVRPWRRDPEFDCTDFEPGPMDPMKWAECETDGHYRCAECIWNVHRTQEGTKA